jgi:GT2 family glycosyltransferase
MPATGGDGRAGPSAGPAATPILGMAVNHYWNSPDRAGRALMATTTELGLRMLRRSPVVGSIVLVDGSPEPDDRLAEVCAEIGARYVHEGREIGLAEGYNVGWRSLPEPFVGLMANDIVPHPVKSLEILLDAVQDPEVGLAFPYLSMCDYPPQLARLSVLRHTMRTCEPASMTLNLNVLRRDVLERAGGVDEDYSTGFYDPILVMRVRELGYRAVQVGGARVVHLDRLTKETGGSTLNTVTHGADTERFFREYPQLRTRHGIWGISFWKWPIATTRRAAVLWWLSQKFPQRHARLAAQELAILLEPLLTPYPARRGRGR